MGPRGSADPTHEGRDGLPPVRDFSPGRRHRQHAEASRGHGRIRAPPRWEFRLQALGPHTMPGRVDRWGRAAARTLPTRVGTGCCPSVTSPRFAGIGSTPKRAAVTGASGPRPVGSSTSRRLDRTPCRAAWTRDPGHDMPRLRARCAMPPTPRATRPHRSQFCATSAKRSPTSDRTGTSDDTRPTTHVRRSLASAATVP